VRPFSEAAALEVIVSTWNPFTRRTLLATAGKAAVGLTFVPLLGCESNSVTAKGTGLEFPFITPVSNPDPLKAFFVQYGAQASVTNWTGVPTLNREAWRLRIDGLVNTPQDISFAEIAAEESVTVLKTIRCIIDNQALPGLIGNAVWKGARLRTFLDRAGVNLGQTARFRIYAQDGFTNNLLRDEALLPSDSGDLIEPLLVYEMNGEPLTPEHGFPIRLLVPSKYGYKNVKWITRIEATNQNTVFGSYQERLGFVDDAVIRPVTKVSNPQRTQQIPAGAFRVFGYAMSGYAGVASIEVSVDGGPFEPAQFLPLSEITSASPEVAQTLQGQDPTRFAYPFRDVWALFEFNWDARVGEHTIVVRTTDRDGNTQPETDQDATDGVNPYFSVNVTVT
jgi:DMSO/TMAO reductase YedYZ molybdopterin-dependent catalytic subunit